MIHIPGGTFMMGGESYWSDAKPEHLVSLDDFNLCRYPVSQKLWEEVMGEKPSRFQNPNWPVEEISWYLITNKFLPALRKKNGIGDYCLPTEAQWEYAARGGEKGVLINRGSLTFSGSEDLNEVGWHSDNSFNETQNTGLKRPNVWGLYGMSGNAGEWCQDWYSRYYYQTLKDQYGEKPVWNPEGENKRSFKVVRGGAWIYKGPANYGVSSRNFLPPYAEFNSFGFRLARYSRA